MTVSVLLFFLTVSWVGLLCMIEVFPDHNHLVFGATIVRGCSPDEEKMVR